MTDLPDDIYVIVIRRGSAMRACFPFLKLPLAEITAPELASMAVSVFMELQMQSPGRADMPITSKTGAMALVLPDADEPLDRLLPLWPQLEGSWTYHDIAVMDDMAPYLKNAPATVLSLVDLN